MLLKIETTTLEISFFTKITILHVTTDLIFSSDVQRITRIMSGEIEKKAKLHVINFVEKLLGK